MNREHNILGKIAFGILFILSLPVFAQVSGTATKGVPGNTTAAQPNTPPGSNVPTGSSPYGGVNNGAVSGATNPAEPDAERGNWQSENRYWRDHYPATPYYNRDTDYSMYEPAYQYGVDAFNQYNRQEWDNIDQARLRAGWEKAHGNSTLNWEQARNAAHDSYMRVYNNRNIPSAASTGAVTVQR